MNLPDHTSLDHLLALWRAEPTIAANIVTWQVEPERMAQLTAVPADLHPLLRAYLHQQGIDRLYAHQTQSWDAAHAGRNVAIVTSTASGKTLGYALPVMDQLLNDRNSTALFLFPTKALTQDQYQGLKSISAWVADAAAGAPLGIAVYDGDTPPADRASIRKKARLVLTNPDMLHTGILPHHTLWADFFRNLRYVVIDEIHIYRGVFGSHVANVMRRLKRIAHFYGAHPQFILTSATIANPGELAERLIEDAVTVIDQDGSPRGKRHFLLYNPPITNVELGLRAAASTESIRLVSDLLHQNIQSLLFCRARRSVELMLRNLQLTQPGAPDRLRAYRSGYLPSERRSIEQAMRKGEARAVVATNALELGIDVGGMDAVILVGYPGSIASTRQQAGRAGRKQGDALAVMVAGAGPLDQYLMQHPDFVFERSPERALINPDNLLILLQHLRCAAFEIPFKPHEGFGQLPREMLESFLQFLVQTGEMVASSDSYFWMSDKYPGDQVSLRSSSPMTVALQNETLGGHRVIGSVDRESALWMVHPQAIYLHGGVTYEVTSLDLEASVAHIKPVDVDYFTEPKKQVEVEKLAVQREMPVRGGKISYGELMVTTQVTGYRRLKWFSNENLGDGVLELPPSTLRTTGYWLSIAQETIDTLRDLGQWSNDPNNYGANWTLQRRLALMRDKRTCQACGQPEKDLPLHVHHKIPFRQFTSYQQANQLDNLVSLCPACHQKAEAAVKTRSGLSGLGYAMQNLAPLFLMCDISDLGMHADPLSPLAENAPAPVIVLYDMVPGGIGLSEAIYEMHDTLMQRTLDLVSHCACQNGCPSCVGPAGTDGIGGKDAVLALLHHLCESTQEGES